MRTFKVGTISRVGKRTYRIVLQPSDDASDVAFEMTVGGSPIAVVNWGAEFSEFVQKRTGPLGPLFEAVLRFHEAAQLDIVGHTLQSES